MTVYQNDVPTAKFAPNHEMIKHFKLVILSMVQYKTKPQPAEQCTENEFFFHKHARILCSYYRNEFIVLLKLLFTIKEHSIRKMVNSDSWLCPKCYRTSAGVLIHNRCCVWVQRLYPSIDTNNRSSIPFRCVGQTFSYFVGINENHQ